MQLLLRDDNLYLKKTIKICQSYEQANRQADEMNGENQSSVHKESEHPNPRNRKSTNKLPYMKTTQTTPQDRGEKMCKFCGNKYVLEKELCPAWGKTCKMSWTQSF